MVKQISSLVLARSLELQSYDVSVAVLFSENLSDDSMGIEVSRLASL